MTISKQQYLHIVKVEHYNDLEDPVDLTTCYTWTVTLDYEPTRYEQDIENTLDAIINPKTQLKVLIHVNVNTYIARPFEVS